MQKSRDSLYFLVTDRWFDPVIGQDDPVAGEMVGIRRIGQDGDLVGRKYAHTVRGLAAQQFHPAGLDYVALAKARREAKEDGTVVGIGRGRTVRERPKMPGLK
ncbi:MAG: hypothetical protein F8N36_14460 [Desulfovibrio sp.]|uniref:hypothetical protein n=1 Tax=Desulfovibrio sp. TaxID=885 RepID=UPI00135E85EC|nr:hypothetical protein [Desulfovibrio sp.]MTJ94041.1 hypothetical protein [Desulfovibrio sp.]